jgi:hypothetical protein
MALETVDVALAASADLFKIGLPAGRIGVMQVARQD